MLERWRGSPSRAPVCGRRVTVCIAQTSEPRRRLGPSRSPSSDRAARPGFETRARIPRQGHAVLAVSLREVLCLRRDELELAPADELTRCLDNSSAVGIGRRWAPARTVPGDPRESRTGSVVKTCGSTLTRAQSRGLRSPLPSEVCMGLTPVPGQQTQTIVSLAHVGLLWFLREKQRVQLTKQFRRESC